jgi:heme-degrading monooxygenase HmoA
MVAIIWKFAVKPGLENDFEAVYGPDGVWVQYFRRGDGYVETELLRDASAPGYYVTIDRWESQAAYENFRTRFAAGYSAIDQECEVLTETESEVGTYEMVESKSPGGNIQDDDKL